jgi:hypothetical protein
LSSLKTTRLEFTLRATQPSVEVTVIANHRSGVVATIILQQGSPAARRGKGEHAVLKSHIPADNSDHAGKARISNRLRCAVGGGPLISQGGDIREARRTGTSHFISSDLLTVLDFAQS